MTRLQQAEQQLQEALQALESAVESVMTPDPADMGAGGGLTLSVRLPRSGLGLARP